MQLFLGQSTQYHDLQRYAGAGLTLKEYLAEPGRLPSIAKLKALRAAAPEGMHFCVSLPVQALLAPDTRVAALRYGLKTIAAVAPDWVLLRTAADFRPSARAQRELTGVVHDLREHTQAKVVWEPRGLWEASQIEAITSPLGIASVTTPERVLREAPPEGDVFLRWRLLGALSRVNEFTVEDVAARLLGADRVFVLAEGERARPLLKTLSETLTELSELEDDEQALPDGEEDPLTSIEDDDE